MALLPLLYALFFVYKVRKIETGKQRQENRDSIDFKIKNLKKKNLFYFISG